MAERWIRVGAGGSVTIYVVQQGDHLSGIAREPGFADYRTIWNHADNAQLRKDRENPHVLNPGDVIHIPEKESKSVSRPTGQMHRFIVGGPSLKLGLALFA